MEDQVPFAAVGRRTEDPRNIIAREQPKEFDDNDRAKLLLTKKEVKRVAISRTRDTSLRSPKRRREEEVNVEAAEREEEEKILTATCTCKRLANKTLEGMSDELESVAHHVSVFDLPAGYFQYEIKAHINETHLKRPFSDIRLTIEYQDNSRRHLHYEKVYHGHHSHNKRTTKRKRDSPCTTSLSQAPEEDVDFDPILHSILFPPAHDTQLRLDNPFLGAAKHIAQVDHTEPSKILHRFPSCTDFDAQVWPSHNPFCDNRKQSHLQAISWNTPYSTVDSEVYFGSGDSYGAENIQESECEKRDGFVSCKM